jgi:hypothetical protein
VLEQVRHRELAQSGQEPEHALKIGAITAGPYLFPI